MITIDIKKSFKSKNKIINFTFKTNFKKHEITAIFGISGAGKTTLLRLISGLDTPDSGYIEVDNVIWFDSNKRINLKPQNRDISYVFQNYALFPNMTVLENLIFAQDKKDEKLISELLKMVNLEEFINTYPKYLSGGQKQRVALIRSIARKPKILLLDEALSALDATMRLELQNDIEKMHKRFSMTTIIISHDIAEVYKLASSVIIIENGEVKKEGNPDILFKESSSSGKFKFSAKILKIKKSNTNYVITLLINNNLTKVVASESEVKQMKVGDNVLVASKAFNPIIITQ